MIRLFSRVRNRLTREILRLPPLAALSERSYQQRRTHHRSYLPALSPDDTSLLDQIKKVGVAVTSLASLQIEPAQDLLQEARSLAASIRAQKAASSQEFVIHAPTQLLVERPKVYQFGLEDRLLRLVESAIGLPVAYHGVYLRRDLANGVTKRSRLWHIDMEDRSVLKVIVYLEDVQEGGGPFEYIPRQQTDDILNTLGQKYGYFSQEQIQSMKPDIHTCTGLAGTVIFADAARVLHRGQPPVQADRYTLFFDYTSRYPLHPFYCKSPFTPPQTQQLTQNLPDWKRDCVYW